MVIYVCEINFMQIKLSGLPTGIVVSLCVCVFERACVHASGLIILWMACAPGCVQDLSHRSTPRPRAVYVCTKYDIYTRVRRVRSEVRRDEGRARGRGDITRMSGGLSGAVGAQKFGGWVLNFCEMSCHFSTHISMLCARSDLALIGCGTRTHNFVGNRTCLILVARQITHAVNAVPEIPMTRLLLRALAQRWRAFFCVL